MHVPLYALLNGVIVIWCLGVLFGMGIDNLINRYDNHYDEGDE